MNTRRVGYRFRPKIEFLIQLLQFVAAGGEDISGCTEYPEDICYLEMYGPGKEPWKIFSGEHEVNELQDINKRNMREKFVVTHLTKLGIKNVTRIAGAGSWDDQSTAKPVMYDGHEMGYWRTLTYEYWGDDGAADGKSYYYMNELHLSDYALSLIPAVKKDMVICRILKNTAKHCRIRRGKKRPTHYNSTALKKIKKNNKKIRCEEKTIASSSCPKVVVPEEELDDDRIVNTIPSVHEEYYSQQIDFAGSSFPELQAMQEMQKESSKAVYIEPGMFCCKPEIPVQEQDVAAFLSDDFPGSVYVQDMYGVAENDREQKAASLLSDDFSGSVYVQNMCAGEEDQERNNASFLSDDFSGSVYVPNMFGAAENYQEPQQVGSFCPELWNYKELQPEDWAPASCSSTLPEQLGDFGFGDGQFNMDEIWEIVGESNLENMEGVMEFA